MGRIDDKIAFITGSSSGIGEACALRFAREGARVAGFDLQQPSDALRDGISKCGSELFFQEGNICDEAAVSRAVLAAVEHFGDLHCLVHAAGTSGAGMAHNMDASEWDRVVDVNLKGSFLVAKHLLRHMMNRRAGSLVLISSVEGITGGNIVPHYNASKGGVVQLCRNLAMDYGHFGIRVNSLCPGYIDTPMLAYFQENAPPEMRRRMELAHMLERFGKPEEVAAAALFLCSDDASFVTGHALAVDGGFTAGHRLEVAQPSAGADSDAG